VTSVTDGVGAATIRLSSTGVSYDQVADEYTVFGTSGGNVVVPGNPAFDIGIFDGATDLASGIFTSSSDASTVSLYLIESEGIGVRFARLEDTVATGTGTVDMTGAYLALLADEVTGDVAALISGNASLTFDFATSTTSGDITNRILRDAEDATVIVGATVGSVTLVQTAPALSTGLFLGGVTGGSADLSSLVGGSPTTTASRGYSVYLAGETADEAVGSVPLLHTPVGGGNNLLETGALALGH